MLRILFFFLNDAYELLLNELGSTLQSFVQKPIMVIFVTASYLINTMLHGVI